MSVIDYSAHSPALVSYILALVFSSFFDPLMTIPICQWLLQPQDKVTYNPQKMHTLTHNGEPPTLNKLHCVSERASLKRAMKFELVQSFLLRQEMFWTNKRDASRERSMEDTFSPAVNVIFLVLVHNSISLLHKANRFLLCKISQSWKSVSSDSGESLKKFYTPDRIIHS